MGWNTSEESGIVDLVTNRTGRFNLKQKKGEHGEVARSKIRVNEEGYNNCSKTAVAGQKKASAL